MESEKLIVIGRFSSATEAHLAKNLLEGAGILATINGAEISSLFASVSSFHAVELLVREDDTFRASCILDPDAGDDESQGAASDAVQPASPITAPGAEHGQVDEDADEDANQAKALMKLNTRELAAYHAYHGAILGLGLWPLQLHVFWLLLKVIRADEPLKPELRRQAIIAGLINAPFMLVSLAVVAWLARAAFD